MNNHKYGAIATDIDGIRFDSKAEARRYGELKLLRLSGDIAGLLLQPEYELQPAFTDAQGKKQKAIKYVGDFSYIDMNTGKLVVEDVKGMATREFKLKAKMMAYRYPEIELRVVEA